MLGIIGAMSIETDGLIAKMSQAREIIAGNYKYISGKLGGKEIVVCRCGIGKVFSSTAAALMIDKFGVSEIINIGVAGGAKPLRQGDIVVADRTVQHDCDSSADGLALGQVNGFDSPYFTCDSRIATRLCAIMSAKGFTCAAGTIASGDCFVSDTAKAKMISDTFGAIAYDMESAAINQVCNFQGVSFCSMRAISDNGDDGALKSFYEFVEEAAVRSIAVISEYIANSD